MLIQVRVALVNHSTKSCKESLLTKKAFNSEVWTSQPRSGYADQPSNYGKCGSKPPP